MTDTKVPPYYLLEIQNIPNLIWSTCNLTKYIKYIISSFSSMPFVNINPELIISV